MYGQMISLNCISIDMCSTKVYKVHFEVAVSTETIDQVNNSNVFFSHMILNLNIHMHFYPEVRTYDCVLLFIRIGDN